MDKKINAVSIVVALFATNMATYNFTVGNEGYGTLWSVIGAIALTTFYASWED